MENAAQQNNAPLDLTNENSSNMLGFTIERSNLIKSLSKLQSFVEKRNTIPILSNIKIASNQAGLNLTVTDMDLVASEEIEAKIQNEGSITVPANTLYDIVRKLPEGSQIKAELDAESSRVLVTSGNSKFTLSYLPADEFPVMSEGELSHTFTLKAKEFLNLIDKTKFAMSTEETRYYLNGVYFHNVEEKIVAVATDGHRLAKVEIDAPEGAKNMPGIIVPRKAVNEISKILENQEEVTISLSDSKIKFNAGKVELLSKVVDGTFPDYQRVIPDNNTKALKINTSALKEAVDRVSTVAADKTKAIKIALSTNNMSLTSQGVEGTSANETVECDYASDELEAGFNSRYLLEMLNLIEGDDSNFQLETPNAPVIVTDTEDETALFIIMPMRV